MAAFISPKLGTTKMSFNRWVNEQAMVPPYWGIHVSNKKEERATVQVTLKDTWISEITWWVKAHRKRVPSTCLHSQDIRKWEHHSDGARIAGGGQPQLQGESTRESGVGVTWTYMCIRPPLTAILPS